MVQKMKVQVTIKIPAKARVEKAFTIAVAAGDTVAKLKEVVLSGSIPVPFPDTQLFLRGAKGVLEERSILLDCGVGQGCCLDLVVKASEDTLVDQLANLLQANNKQSMGLEEISSLYVLKHGASVGQALNMLGLDSCLRDFLATTKAMSVVLNAAGCATLLGSVAGTAAKADTADSATDDVGEVMSPHHDDESTEDDADDFPDDESDEDDIDDLPDDESDEDDLDALPASDVEDLPTPAMAAGPGRWPMALPPGLTPPGLSWLVLASLQPCPNQHSKEEAEVFVPAQHQYNACTYGTQQQQAFPQNGCIDLDMFSDTSDSDSEDEIPQPLQPAAPVQPAALPVLPQNAMPQMSKVASQVMTLKSAMEWDEDSDDSDSECELWERKESAKYPGRFYYVNTITKETSWKVPTR